MVQTADTVNTVGSPNCRFCRLNRGDRGDREHISFSYPMEVEEVDTLTGWDLVLLEGRNC